MKKTAFLASVFLVCLITAGKAGELKYIAAEPDPNLFSMPLRATLTPVEASETPEDWQVLNPKALVGTCKAGLREIKIVMDSQQKDAEALDVLKLDFTGSGAFINAVVLPLKSPETTSDKPFHANIEPATANIDLGDRTVPAHISGQVYWFEKDRRQVGLMVCTAAEGPCAFGDKTYCVRIVDGNSNLQLGDAAKVVVENGSLGDFTAGDTLVIDTGDGSFKDPTIKTFFGYPVYLDGAFYDVEISSDGSSVAAKPAPVETGYIKFDHDSWACFLAGSLYVARITGGTEPVPVPAGSYAIPIYWLPADTGQDTKQASLEGSVGAMTIEDRRPKFEMHEIEAGETLALTIGPPLTASVTATQQGPNVSFALELVDVGGGQIRNLTGSDGKRPAEPILEVFDTSDQLVYSGKMEYG